MKRPIATCTAALLVLACAHDAQATLYTFDSTIPAAGGCPQPNHFNLALASPVNRRWSTSLPSILQPVILTVAASGTPPIPEPTKEGFFFAGAASGGQPLPQFRNQPDMSAASRPPPTK